MTISFIIISLISSFPMLHAGKAGGGPGVQRHVRDEKGRSEVETI